MPKKVISDPLELLATETTAILNKITPQTFEKLSASMLTLKVENIAMLDKLIEIIFEKAVQEQNFTNLYAELCAFLNASAQHWAFYTDAKNKNFFRARLVSNCQNEFQISTKNESAYGDLEEEKKVLLQNKATMSESDLAQKSAAINDKQLVLKRRMLGNIRFVGELYKQKLLTDVVIHNCIADLMGTANNWKPMSDEQDIECLCRLITTAGERLEAKSCQSEESSYVFEGYFDRMRQLARDKSLNSRMRFGIEELLELRDNRWQRRRAQEGPLKISEIHEK
ncbi:armadillo-type protein, partial [Ochromonadaceae sp. CCMP2298]